MIGNNIREILNKSLFLLSSQWLANLPKNSWFESNKIYVTTWNLFNSFFTGRVLKKVLYLYKFLIKNIKESRYDYYQLSNWNKSISLPFR